MASLLTNHSAITALQTLRMIGQNMETTQKRVSTGQRISEASDNTAYWSISSSMRSDKAVISAVSAAMELGLEQVNVAYTTTEKTKTYLDETHKDLATLYQKGEGDVKKLQQDIQKKLIGISSSVTSAFLAGKNIIANDGEPVRISGSYRREGTAVYVDMIEVGGADLNFAKPQATGGDYDLSNGILNTVFGKAETSSDINALDTAISDGQKRVSEAKTDDERKTAEKAVTDAKEAMAKALRGGGDKLEPGKAYTVEEFASADLSKVSAAGLEVIAKHLQNVVSDVTARVITAGAQLGSAKEQIASQVDFVSKLTDAVTKSIGTLVDADMNEESARLSALQVQQQLGIQSLTIANQNSQNILSLFRG